MYLPSVSKSRNCKQLTRENLSEVSVRAKRGETQG